jgi:hypothetical protein
MSTDTETAPAPSDGISRCGWDQVRFLATEIANEAIAEDAQREGIVASNGELVSGAYVRTAFNSGGQIVVINSMTFYGNQMFANMAVHTAVRAVIGAE